MEEYFIIDIHKSSKNILIILFIGLLIRLILAPFFTSYDLQLFKKTCEWFYTAGLNPLVWWTYGPVLLIILLASYVPYSTFVIISTKHSEFLLNLFIKTPQILGDIIVTLILYKLILYITKEEKKALKVSMLYIFSPFSVILSAVYGYLDSIMVTFILLSLFYLLKYKEKISALLFVASIATKFASIILLPIYLFYLKRHNGSIYKYLLYSFLSSIILSVPYIIMLTKVIDNPLIFLTILIDRAGFLKPYAASISNIPLTRWSIFTFPKEVLGIDFMGFIPGGFPILVLISYFFVIISLFIN